MKALEYVIGQLKNNYKENPSYIIDKAQKIQAQSDLELLIDFQIHLKDRDLIEDFNHDFEDEAKIFLYNKQFKNNE